MYISKYWWEIVGVEGDYVRFRHKGHYIRVHKDKVEFYFNANIRGLVGYPARIENYVGLAYMRVFKPDHDVGIQPELAALLDITYNRWRKLMGRKV